MVNENDSAELEGGNSLEDETFKPKVCDSDLHENMPIYERSALTLSVSMMLIITLIRSHSMTGAAVLDLLTLETHMLAPNL